MTHADRLLDSALNGEDCVAILFRSRTAPETELPAFGRILRRLRRRYDLSQEELAEEIGLARKGGMIYLIEHGRRRVTEAFLQKLADRFAGGVVPTVWRDALAEAQSPLMSPKPNLADIELPPLGKCLATLRRTAVGSRADLAALIGLTQGDVQDIEFGTVPVSKDVLRRMADAFGLDGVPDEWLRLRQLSNQHPPDEPLPRPSALSPFGHILRNERRVRKMTLKTAADAIGVSAPFLHSLEYGRVTTVPERIIGLARLFGFAYVPDAWIDALNTGCRSMIREGVISPDSPAAEDWGPRIRAEEAAEKSG